jgi:hypothetical protein
LSLLLYGSFHTVTYTSNDEELEKQLATLVDAGDEVITFDNAKRQQRFKDDSVIVESAALERSITAPVLNYRRLGSNASIRRRNDVQFCLTLNNPILGSDLRRRINPICLEFEGNVDTRLFSIPDLDDFLFAHRAELLAEILGLVDRWIRAGFPMPERPARHSISQTWAATIDAILRSNGLVDFLMQGPSEADSDRHGVDFDYTVMEQVCVSFHDGPRAPAKVWASRLRELDVLRDRLLGKSGVVRSEQAQATIVGMFFQRYENRVFQVPNGGKFRLFSTRQANAKSHASVEYWFEEIEESESATSSGLANGQRQTLGGSEPEEPVS